jgi:hypothetical protein
MTRAVGAESSYPSVVLRTDGRDQRSASTHARNKKIRPSKSRRRSCVPRARAKCKCDLQQPCSYCTAKKKEHRHQIRHVCQSNSTGGCFRDTTIPSASPHHSYPRCPHPIRSQISRHREASQRPLLAWIFLQRMFSRPSDLTDPHQNWPDYASQFIDQYCFPGLQDVFFDWNVPPGCNPLDFTSTSSLMYAPTETTPLGIYPIQHTLRLPPPI